LARSDDDQPLGVADGTRPVNEARVRRLSATQLAVAFAESKTRLQRKLWAAGLNSQDAQDALQEVYVRALKRPYDGSADPKAVGRWLRDLARYEIETWRRRSVAQRSMGEPVSADEVALPPVEGDFLLHELLSEFLSRFYDKLDHADALLFIEFFEGAAPDAVLVDALTFAGTPITVGALRNRRWKLRRRLRESVSRFLRRHSEADHV